MPSESDKWGWRHVSVFGDFDKGSGTKRWKCNHCNLRYNGSYSRVRAHLLGFTGAGVKSCPAIDRSLREAFQILEEERVARKKKRTSRNGKPGKNIRTQQNLTRALKTVTREDVDDVVARFFYADGLNLKIVNSPYFHEMAKAISSFGPSYEPPSIDKLSDSFLIKEKARMEKAIALIKESWPHTACTIICVNRLDGMPGFFCINIFISSPRGLMFLKKVDINEGDSADILFTNVLSDVIMEVGPTNVLQVISHLGHASESFESLIVSKFPHIFWSPCTSLSIHTLMEDMAEMDWIKPVVLCAKGIEQCIQMFRRCSLCAFTQNSEVRFDPLPAKLAPSYCIVQKVFEQKQALKEVLVCEEWKQWKVTIAEDIINVETSILGNDFWERAHMLLQVFEPFVKLIVNLDIHKSVMGDVYFWWFQALEAVKCKGNDGIALDQLELLIESRWDILFSPLHATGYLLNPRYFGRGQTKDKTVMRGWKTTLERYKHDSAARRILRVQLSSYCRLEGSLGEEDAVDCRDKMDPVAWWENFGFEIPHLQTLAIKILSQVPSDAVCQESWQHNDFPCRETANGLGVDRVDDLIFVQNNLKLQSLKHGNLKFASGQRSGSFCTPSGSNMRDGALM